MPVVVQAIQYDVRRGKSLLALSTTFWPFRLPPLPALVLVFFTGSISVGSHVRDAACYVCWAFARAYSPEVMRPHVQELCQGMLVTSLFDREINCRRAGESFPLPPLHPYTQTGSSQSR